MSTVVLDRIRSRWALVLTLALSLALALAALLAGPPAEAADRENSCPAGSFCAWPETDFFGDPQVFDVSATGLEQCVEIETDWEAQSFVNNTGHPVTVYQDPDCDEQAEFDTYPTGSQAARSGYVARAIQIWSH